MNFHIHTLGCKINHYESECIIQAWENQGLSYTNDMIHADILIINSCAVTENAIKEVTRLCAYLQRELFTGRIILTGCASIVLTSLDTGGIPYIVIPQKDKEQLLCYPTHSLNTHNIHTTEQESDESSLFNEEEEEPFILTSSLRARATVKVQDGCSHRCTYCIIPFTRGASKSRSLSSISKEIRALLHSGHREIVLSGINLRQFGLDFTFPMDFWDLVQYLEKEFAEEWQGEARFRISSLEPCQLNEKALDILAKTKLICPHLHISLQSASDAILQKMARSHYSTYMLSHAIEKVQHIWKYFALGVDIITGFPGETEEEFIRTQTYLQELPITYAHIFPFSERPFTKAPSLPNQIYPHIRKERSKLLRALAQEKHTAFITQLLKKGIPQYIIPEKTNPKKGISQYYIECKSESSFSSNTQAYIPTHYDTTYLYVHTMKT